MKASCRVKEGGAEHPHLLHQQIRYSENTKSVKIRGEGAKTSYGKHYSSQATARAPRDTATCVSSVIHYVEEVEK